MTIPASTVPAAKAFLVTAITTAINDTSVLVSYDEPGTYQTDDIVMVGRVDRQVERHAFVGSGGAQWLYEIYTIEVVVRAYRGGDDAQTVFERACALADVVASAVRTDPTLGGVVLVANPSTAAIEPDWDDNHLGRIATATIGVLCEAQI